MRRIALIAVVCVALFVPNLSFASDRVVVSELFTNTSCSTCLDANNTLDDIADDFRYGLAVIRYHTWWPSQYDPFYVFNQIENTARVDYYDVGYTPHFFTDGTIDGEYHYNAWRDQITTEISVSSPLIINETGTYNPVSKTGTVNIELIATETIAATKLALRVALTESNIYWAAPNGGTYHDQTFRDMITSTSGIPITINLGDTLNYSLDFACPAPLDYTNCHLVAFLQSDSDKRILQGALLSVDRMEYTLEPFSLISPENNSILEDCYPDFIWESTEDSDSGYAVDYRVMISTRYDFADPIMSNPQSDTTWHCPLCLQGDTTYYWRVLASTGHTPDRYSEDIHSFTVDPGELTISPPGLFENYMVSGSFSAYELILSNESSLAVEYLVSNSEAFVELDTESGILGAQQADTIGISLSSDGLEPGEYYDTVLIETDHPESSSLTAPIQLTVYIHGDVNCDDRIIGSDVTYLVNYFRAIAAPFCDPFLRGDTNGDCAVIGSDVTFLVNYFRGISGEPHPGDCE